MDVDESSRDSYVSLIPSYIHQGGYEKNRASTYNVFVLDTPSTTAELFAVNLKDYIETSIATQSTQNIQTINSSANQPLTEGLSTPVTDNSNGFTLLNSMRLFLNLIFSHSKKDPDVMINHVKQANAVVILLSDDIFKSPILLIELFHAILNRKPIIAVDIDGLGYSDNTIDSIYKSFEGLPQDSTKLIQVFAECEVDDIVFMIKNTLPFITPKRFSYKDSRTVRNAFLRDILNEMLNPPPLQQLPAHKNDNLVSKSKKQKVSINGSISGEFNNVQIVPSSTAASSSNSSQSPDLASSKESVSALDVSAANSELSNHKIDSDININSRKRSRTDTPTPEIENQDHVHDVDADLMIEAGSNIQQLAEKSTENQLPIETSTQSFVNSSTSEQGKSTHDDSTDEDLSSVQADNTSVSSPESSVEIPDIVKLNPGLVFDREILEAIFFLEKRLKSSNHDEIELHCRILFAATGEDNGEKDESILLGISKINGVPTLLAIVLDTYAISQPNTVISCLKVLRNLTSSKETRAAYRDLLMNVINVIKRNKMYPLVQIWGCQVLENLVPAALTEKLVVYQAIDALLDILSEDKEGSTPELQEKNLRAILNLCINAELKQYFMKRKVEKKLIDVLKTYKKEEEIQCIGWTVLMNIIRNETRVYLKLVDHGLLDVLADILKINQKNAKIFKFALKTLRDLVTISDVIANKASSLNWTEMYSYAYKNHKGDVEVMNDWITTISVISMKKENIPNLISEEFLQTLCGFFDLKWLDFTGYKKLYDIFVLVLECYNADSFDRVTILKFLSKTSLNLSHFAAPPKQKVLSRVSVQILKLILEMVYKYLREFIKKNSEFEDWIRISIFNKDYVSAIFINESNETKQYKQKPTCLNLTVMILSELKQQCFDESFSSLDLDFQLKITGGVIQEIAELANGKEREPYLSLIFSILKLFVNQAQTIPPATDLSSSSKTATTKAGTPLKTLQKGDIQGIFAELEKQYKILKYCFEGLNKKSPTEKMLTTSSKCLLTLLLHGNNQCQQNIISQLSLVTLLLQTSSYMNDMEFWKLASSVLSTLSNIPEFESLLVLSNLHTIALEAMKKNPSHILIQQNGCITLWNLSYKDINQIRLVKDGAIETLSACLRLHSTHVDIQKEGLAALANFASNSRNIDSIMLETDSLMRTISAIKENIGVPSVLYEAGRVLWNLSGNSRARLIELRSKVSASKEASNGSQQEISPDEITRDKYETIAKEQSKDIGLCALQMMKTHPTDIEILKNSCGILRNSIDEMDEESKEYFCQEGIIQQLLLALKVESGDPKLQHNAYYTLWNASWRKPVRLEEIMNGDGIQLVISGMKQHANDVEVQRKATSLIWSLLADDKSSIRSRQDALKYGVVDTTLNISMKSHPGNEEIQANSAGILKYMLVDDQVRAALFPAIPLIVECLAQAMKNHAKNAFVQQYSCGALVLAFKPVKLDNGQEVIAYTNLDQAQKRDISKFTISAIENHVKDYGVIRQSSILIKHLLKSEDFKAYLLELSMSNRLTKVCDILTDLCNSGSMPQEDAKRIKKALQGLTLSLPQSLDKSMESETHHDTEISMSQSFLQM